MSPKPDRETLFKLFLIYQGISPDLWEQWLKERSLTSVA